MRKLFLLFIPAIVILNILSTAAYSNEIYDTVLAGSDTAANSSTASATASDYYEKGMLYLNQRQFTKAIEEFKKALVLNPDETSIRNNLSVAYSSRGTYYYNKNISLEKAANDYRSSLYYLKYYIPTAYSETIAENINVTEDNLKNIFAIQKFKTTPENRLKKAKELRGQGEFIPAAVEFIMASEKPDQAYECYVALGDIMRISEEEQKAATYYDKALTLKSSDPEVHLKFARILYKTGNIQSALAEYNIAMSHESTKSEAITALESIWRDKIQDNQNDATAHMNLGAVLQKKGDLDRAMSEYKNAQLLDPQSPAIRLNIATLFQQQGNYLMAINAYDSILEAYPTDSLAHYYKASALKKLGRPSEAIAEYETVLGLDPANNNAKKELLDTIKSLPTAQSLEYMYNMAMKNPQDYNIQYSFAYLLHTQKRYDEALAYYQQAIQLNPKALDPYLNMANIYKDMGKDDLAAETLKKAEVIHPNNAKIKEYLDEYENEALFAKIDKASELYQKKDYAGALKLYKSITEPSAEVYLGIGACYQAMENYDEAIKAYTLALNDDSKNPNVYYFLGLGYFYKGSYAEAQKNLETAKQLDPINPDITDAIKSVAYAQSEKMMDKGLDYYNAKQYNEALKQLNLAIQKSPTNGYAYYYRGMTYDALKKFQLSITDYKKAITYAKDLNVVYYALASDYEILKNNIEAKKMYKKFVEVSVGTNDEYTRYAKSRLKELK